ncbi:MAG TPA: hypothetical protein VN622_03040 [Clostridia bacterium]|nr:hypothetical protein [Clostridia bacterium]
MKFAYLFVALSLLIPAVAFAGDNYADLLRHFEYDIKAPLNVREVGVVSRAGAKVHDITYVGANGTVPAYLVVPNGNGPFAAVVWGHWMLEGSPFRNRTEFLDEAIALAESGVVSLLIDAPMVRPGFKDTEPDPIYMRDDVIDLRRGLDLLLARTDVDQRRTAFVGHSFHAGSGAILSGVDRRVKAFVLMAGGLDTQQFLVSKAPVLAKIGLDVRERVARMYAEYSWINPCQYVSRAAPAVVLLQNGTRDEYMTVDDVRHYSECVSNPKTEKMYGTGHELNAKARLDRAEWLRQQLGLKALNTAALKSVPPIH